MKKVAPYWPLILALALLKFFLPFVLQSPVYELHRDEYLYYQQALHPALGYLENPPLLPWLASLTLHWGPQDFWIKAWSSLIGSLTLVFACLTAAELGGNRYAQLLTGLCLTTGAFMRMHFLFQPNLLDVFGWTLSLYFLVRYCNAPGRKWLLWLCFSIALAFWGKFSIVFLAASIFLALLLTPQRKLFREPFFYFSAAIAILLVLPQLYWQWMHRWPVLHHMEELRDTQLRFIDPLGFIKDQFLLILPALFVWIAGLIWLFRQPTYRVLGFTYMIVIALLVLAHGKNYYAMGVYPLLLAAGAVALERWSLGKQWLRWIFLLVVISLSYPLLRLMLPTEPPAQLATSYAEKGLAATGVLKWEDQQDHLLPQDFADMLGWKELASKAEAFYSILPDSVRETTIIYCRNYGQAGALRFYGRHSDFRERVISDNGSFVLWIPDSLRFRHLLFIGRRAPDPDDEVFQHFRSSVLVDSVANPYSRQLGDRLIFFANADNQALNLAREGLRKKRELFGR